MRRHAAALALTLCLAAIGHAGSPAPAPAPPAAAVSPAQLAALIRRADTAVIAFENWKNQRESKDAVVTERAWIEQLAAIVESGPLEPRSVCFCVSTPRIELYNRQGLITKLTLHHDTKLRNSGAGFGDFEIGAERSRAILDLAMAEEKNARERVLPKLRESRTKR